MLKETYDIFPHSGNKEWKGQFGPIYVRKGKNVALKLKTFRFTKDHY
jgi:hypothetical protein